MKLSVTVIIPTYNYAHFITAAIDSVLNQKYEGEIEIVVVDDGSTDSTEQVLQNYIANGSIRYYYQDNSGKAAATKRAIGLSTGSIIFNLDADDYFLNQKIEKTVEIFGQNLDVVHVATPAHCIKEVDGSHYVEQVPGLLFGKNNGLDVLSYFYKENILYGGGSTFAARASVLKKLNIPTEVDMYIDEYLVLATLGNGCTYFLMQPLSVWRIHDRNYSGGGGESKLVEKSQRLLKSSLGVLKSLGDLHLPKLLVSIYELRHRVREMVLKEESNKKSAGDIFRFFLFLLFSGNSIIVLKNHSAFNRLIPAKLLYFLKGKNRWSK